MGRLIEEMSKPAWLVTTEGLQPSSKGRRFKFAGGKHASSTAVHRVQGADPATGSSRASLQDATEWAPRYGAAVGAPSRPPSAGREI